MNKVGIIKTVSEYPPPPYSPSEKYSEYQYKDYSSVRNYVYEGVRNLFISLKLDETKINKETWNPLKCIIDPNDVVVIKPNMVNSEHLGNGVITSVITHASVIRPVIDYVLIALKGSGRIIIADSPERMADFKEILRKTGIQHIISYYKESGINIEVRDLRREKIRYGLGAIVERKIINADPEGYRIINLGKHSAFYNVEKGKLMKLYGADYNRKETLAHHRNDVHEYEIAGTIMNADVIVSMPKLKTHQKAGVTLNLKGFIGCTGNKNLIPHRTLGDPTVGGDSYPGPSNTKRGALIRWLIDILKDNLLGTVENKYSAIIYSGLTYPLTKILHVPLIDIEFGGGQWHGNDTLWRSVIDVARIIIYSDKNGNLNPDKQRKVLCVIDGIHAGDRKGPLEPRIRKEGIIMGGLDPVITDITAAQLMGIDWEKIFYLKEASKDHMYDLSKNVNVIKIRTNYGKFNNLFELPRHETLCFEPAPSWQGAIELNEKVGGSDA